MQNKAQLDAPKRTKSAPSVRQTFTLRERDEARPPYPEKEAADDGTARARKRVKGSLANAVAGTPVGTEIMGQMAAAIWTARTCAGQWCGGLGNGALTSDERICRKCEEQ